MSELIKMGTYFKSVVTCYAEIENCVLKQEEWLMQEASLKK